MTYSRRVVVMSVSALRDAENNVCSKVPHSLTFRFLTSLTFGLIAASTKSFLSNRTELHLAKLALGIFKAAHNAFLPSRSRLAPSPIKAFLVDNIYIGFIAYHSFAC